MKNFKSPRFSASVCRRPICCFQNSSYFFFSNGLLIVLHRKYCTSIFNYVFYHFLFLAREDSKCSNGLKIISKAHILQSKLHSLLNDEEFNARILLETELYLAQHLV